MSLRTIILSFVLCLMPVWVIAETAPELPATNWLNAPPLTKSGIAGKVIVLYFYEEACPTCRAAWPDRLKTATSFADKPVIFVAVNSGSSPADVAGYLKSVNCNWPAIVDTDRSFEQASLGKQISLQNIIQVRVISPTGELMNAGFDPSAQINQVLPAAKWKIDPKEIPEAVKIPWQLFEIGQYNQAAGGLNQIAKGLKDDAAKAAAEKIHAAILVEFQQLNNAAVTAEQAGDAWTAFKGYQQSAQAFSNLPEAKELKSKLTKLATDAKVIRQQKAAKLWQDARQAASAPNPATQKRGVQLAQQLVKDYSDTDAGEAAKKALEQAGIETMK